MSLAKLSEIDISNYEKGAWKLIDSCGVEGLYIDPTHSLLQGDFFDGCEVQSVVQVGPKGYYCSCSACGGSLCAHSSAIILCYSEKKDSFEQVAGISHLQTLPSKANPYKKTSVKEKKRKPLTKKFEKMIEGVDLSLKLLDEILKNSFSASDMLFQSRIKTQLNNLDAYYLGGVKLEMLELLQSISIQQPGDDFLSELEFLYRLLRQGKEELKGVIEQQLSSMPYSEILTLFGHVWKYEELLNWNEPRDSCLIQLNFDVKENLTAQRLEENSLWLDLENGKIFLSQNLRPFKALKYIPATDSEFHAINCKGIVEYPGNGISRIRWQRAEMIDLEVHHMKMAFKLASLFSAEELKGLKAQIRDGLSSIVPHRFYKVDRIDANGGQVTVSMNGFQFELADTYQTKVLNTFPSHYLENVACVFSFELNREGDSFIIYPICLLKEGSIHRLGF